MERNNDIQKRFAGFFKQFVNTALIKHFRTSPDTMSQWESFSTLIGQDNIDMDKIQKYLDTLSSKDEVSSPFKANFQSRSKQYEDDTNNNSGIYKKQQYTNTNQVQRIDFQLNKTVGGNADRIKFTGLLSQKSNNPYTFERDKKKMPNQPKSSTLSSLIESINILTSTMQENQSKLQYKNQPSNSNSNNSYRYK